MARAEFATDLLLRAYRERTNAGLTSGRPYSARYRPTQQRRARKQTVRIFASVGDIREAGAPAANFEVPGMGRSSAEVAKNPGRHAPQRTFATAEMAVSLPIQVVALVKTYRPQCRIWAGRTLSSAERGFEEVGRIGNDKSAYGKSSRFFVFDTLNRSDPSRATEREQGTLKIPFFAQLCRAHMRRYIFSFGLRHGRAVTC